MICGSPSMLDETSEVLDSFGLKISPRMREPGDYLIERAFVEKSSASRNPQTRRFPCGAPPFHLCHPRAYR